MILPILVPALLGLLIVVQAGLNRRIALVWGFPSAVLLSGCVLAGGALLLWMVAYLRPQWFPANFQVELETKSFSLWYLFAGIIGLALVLGTPWSIAHWGAAHTFVLLVSAQLASGILWDVLVEAQPVSLTRIAGVVLAWLGALLAIRG